MHFKWHHFLLITYSQILLKKTLLLNIIKNYLHNSLCTTHCIVATQEILKYNLYYTSTNNLLVITISNIANTAICKNERKLAESEKKI